MSAGEKNKKPGSPSKAWQKKYYWRKGDPITREDQAMLEVLIRKANQLGYVPSKKEVPNSEALRRRFGNWPRAIEAAGLPHASDPEQGRKRAAAMEWKHRMNGLVGDGGNSGA